MKSPRKLTIVNVTVYTGDEVEVVLSEEKSSSLPAKINKLSLPTKMKRLISIDSDVEMYLLQKSSKPYTDAIDIAADNNSSPFSLVAIVPTNDSDHTGDNSDTDTDTDTDEDVKTSQLELARETIGSDYERAHNLFDFDVGSNLLSNSCHCWSGPVVDDFEYLLTI